MALTLYTGDDGMIIYSVDSPFFSNPLWVNAEKLETLEHVAYDYNKNHREPAPTRPHEIAQIFPESKTYLLERNKDINAELGVLMEKEREVKQRLHRHIDKPELDREIFKIKWARDDLTHEKDRNDEFLSFMSRRGGKKAKDFNQSLEIAKQYPISQLVSFVGGKAKCLWHEDKNPSMQYYKKGNKVYCFACQNGGDSIDVVMKMRNCELGEAISFLTNS